jgi:5-methylcytosine-specific restriction enzyme B
MSNVWRVGTNWDGEDAAPDFRAHNIAFAGDEAQDAMKTVEQGDIVAITRGQEIIAVGRFKELRKLSDMGVTGYEASAKEALVLEPYHWKNDNDEWPTYGGQGKRFHKAHGEYVSIITNLFNVSDSRYRSDRMKNQIKRLLDRNKQIILTGAPGTGKTNLAIELAADLLGCSKKDLKDREAFGFVQFHPAYDYTDFVEGLKPVQSGKDSIGFKLRPGIFREFCEKARVKEKQKFVFVIDEINRADLSRVFGELFYALEPGYRGESGRVLTQYSSLREESDRHFYVPANVLIIGTMNDIDRSVESMDFALRRRFAWFEVEANEDRFDAVMRDVLTDRPDLKAVARKRYSKLNDSIARPEEGLGPAYRIGPAYFRKLDLYKDQEEGVIWEDFWRYHLELLIREYVRGMSRAKELVQEFRDAYDLRVDSVEPG